MYKIIISVILICIWYIYMSFCDWYIHKHILHNDNTILSDWREAHKIHHLEHKNLAPKNGIGIGFTYSESLFIGLITSFPILIITFLINKNYIMIVFILHFIGSIIATSIHNYSHSIFHDNKKMKNILQFYIPSQLYLNLHKHHNNHHNNPDKNFCTVFLGFDEIIGTKYLN